MKVINGNTFCDYEFNPSGDEENDIVNFSYYEENEIWMIDSPINAEYARLYNTFSYNCSKDRPCHCYNNWNPEDWEVVEVEVVVIK